MSIQCWCKYAIAGQPILVCLCVGVHRRTSPISLHLFLLQCLVCLLCYTWLICEMGGTWPYSCCLVGLLPGFVQDITQHSLCSPHLAFSVCILLVFMWCINVVVWTLLQLGRNSVLFYRIDSRSLGFHAFADITFSRGDATLVIYELVFKFYWLTTEWEFAQRGGAAECSDCFSAER